jgi:hypothetical protein
VKGTTGIGILMNAPTAISTANIAHEAMSFVEIADARFAAASRLGVFWVIDVAPLFVKFTCKM